MGYYKHKTAVVETNQVGDDTKVWHFVHIRESARLGKNCIVGKGVYIDRDVVIGDRVKIQNFVSIYKGVTIEDDVMVGPTVTFTNDRYPRASRWNDDDIIATFVHKGVSIGANATILCGVDIGAYAMIGAGSVVTKDIPRFGLVYGNPAELNGYVCSCGQKLNMIVKDTDEIIVYTCGDCGKTVEIAKEIYHTYISQ